jgi:release factor glutamine methyltransferase
MDAGPPAADRYNLKSQIRNPMPQTEVWTIGRLLQWTTDYLKRGGSATARLDAEVLLAEALDCRRIQLYTRFDEVPQEAPRAAFRELVRRRAAGTPVAYLVGRREFYSLSFRVNPDVLIPRPETELLVVTLLDLAKSRSPAGPLTIADVGTGSGIIAVCAAKHLPGCGVTAIDVSPAALQLAWANAADHGVQGQIELVESDLFAAVTPGRAFDFIVSNPPYVSTAELKSLAGEVREFEPQKALVAGPHGTEVIEALIPQAAERLSPGGHLLMEISPMIHDAVRSLLEADHRFQLGPTIKDLARLPRVVQAMKRSG